jgi:soluble lytic murein transglycosylase
VDSANEFAAAATRRYGLIMSNRAKSLALATLAIIYAATAIAADIPDTDDSRLLQQRKTFRAVFPDVELGDWQPAARYENQLEDYVLWPDLRATWFRANVRTADHAEIEAFLDRHGVLKPARELRYRYALHLADEGRMDEFFSIYQKYYQGLEIAKLDCLALQAEIEAGREDRIIGRALDLWQVGKSQADECDPVFANLQDRNLLTTQEYARRFELAIEGKRFTLARYLSKPLDPKYRDEANTWIDAQNDPTGFVSSLDERQDKDLDRRQLAYAVERIAFNDPLAAFNHWNNLKQRFSFNPDQLNATSRHIALWSARLHQPGAADWLAALPASAANTESGRWLVRANLLQRRWAEVVRSIDALPADESGKSEWQYWKAIAHAELGETDTANAILREVAAERSYHGFLAADATGAPYALAVEPVSRNDILISEIGKKPEIIRARELFFVGLEGRGRSEWDSAVNLLTDQEQIQAALLAQEWGWHSRAISTIAAAGEFDDLQIRYPLPWRQDFDTHAKSAGIPNSWAYGVARSESLFMRDIRSSAGAIGLMQLMPATGRSTAREISLPYSGLATLTDSNSNIKLGTYYLGKMYTRFDENRVLATAAYNAGPMRVEEWLPTTGTLDARIWIENIPFNETRGYVRRVLTDEAIFHWRLTGQLRRISSELPHISAAPKSASITSQD